jgi:hypothetical protein
MSCYGCLSGRFSNNLGLTDCQDCPNGTYSSTNSSACTLCPLGSFSYGGGKSTCTACAGAWWTSDVGSTSISSCNVCKEGFYKSNSTCVQCPINLYSTAGSTTCSGCAPGRYKGNVSCEDCPSGRFQPDYLQTMCFDCGFGSVNLFGSTAKNSSCLKCPAGKYTNSSASIECLNCDLGFWSPIIGAAGNSSCMKCPDMEGVNCPKGSSFPFVGSGVFRSLDSPDNFTRCFPSDACLEGGYGNTSCANGYAGIGCTTCMLEYFRSFGKCMKCLSKPARWSIIFATGIVLMFIMLKLSQRSQNIPVPLKLMLFWIQFLGLYPALSNAWPPGLSTLLNLTSILNLDIGYLGVGCDFSNSYYSLLVAKILFPVIFCVVLFLFDTCKKFLYKRSQSRLSLLKIFSYMVFAANFFSIQILSSMMQTFNCVDTANNGFRVLQDPTVRCYDQTWTIFIGFDSVMLFFYIIVLPLVLIRMYIKAKKDNDEKVMLAIIRPLTSGCKQGAEWFELSRVFFKLCFVLVRDTFKLSSSGKISFLCLTFLVTIWCESNWRPYESTAHQNLSLLY